MFKLHGCAPRGVVRDRRQQTGRILTPVKGGERTTVKFRVGELRCVETTQVQLFRVQLQLRTRLRPREPELVSVEKLPGMGLAYEVIGSSEGINALLERLGDAVEWFKEVVGRAIPPGLQQSKPYHRR